jgi:hypothetical protein
MTEEDFLARWSRRKRDVAKAQAEPSAEQKPRVAEAKPAATEKAEPEFDPASLPPIESINALTDIKAFLQAGVPADLTRAALRRVWTADPSIRDFVGLAENAWDFTDPAAMPGFGPLESSEEVRRMVASIVDKIGDAAQQSLAQENEEVESASESSVLKKPRDASAQTEHTTQSDVPSENSAKYSDKEVLLHSNEVNTASQQDVGEAATEGLKASRRFHGGALPS